MRKTSRIKWTLEKVLESAKKYNHIYDWELGDNKAYSAAKRNGWFKDATTHMVKKIRKVFTIKYTDEDIFKDALKYDTPQDWANNSPSIYSIAHQRRINKQATQHMHRQLVPRSFYTREKIKEIALKYKTVKEWKGLDNKSYNAAARLGLLNDQEIVGHIVRPERILKYSKKEVLDDAKRFHIIKEWKENSFSTYDFAKRHGFFDEASSHMQRIGSEYYRCIYSIKSPEEKSVYIGLTFNFKKRINEHLQTKRFKKIIDAYGRDSLVIEQLTDYVDKNEASQKERDFINTMKQEGWKILNKIKGGGLGGDKLKWTKEAILENVKKYSSYKAWSNQETGAYAAALDMGIIEEIDEILPRTSGKYKFWTKEKILEESAKWKTRTEFWENAYGAAEASKKLHIYDEATAHMPDNRFKKK